MSWVEDTLVEAFLGGASCADDSLVPEPVRLGWDFDRSSGLYYHRSFGQLFAEEGGVFFDDADKKYFYFDSISMRHEEMNEEQLELLRQCAANANMALPGLAVEEVGESVASVDCASSELDLSTAWQKPWEEWVDGQDATLGFRFFATREPPLVWTVSTTSAQLFRHGAAGYELVGSPTLSIRADDMSSGEEIFACGSTREGCSIDEHPHCCTARYHPGLERWQLWIIHETANVRIGGEAVLPACWATLNVSEGEAIELRVGGIKRMLRTGQKVAEKAAVPGPCGQSAVLHGSFEINPELLPPPPVSREARMEFDNRMRRKAANRLSTTDIAGQARRDTEYSDRAGKRRQLRVEWDDTAALELLHSALANESEEFDNEPEEDDQRNALAEANLNADGSFVGLTNCTRAGLGYRGPADGSAESALPEAQKRRKITLERYLQSVG